MPVTLFKTGLPGLSIPGVGALGPEFVMATRLEWDLNAAMQTTVTNTYNLEMVKMAFPYERNKSANKGNGTPIAPNNGL